MNKVTKTILLSTALTGALMIGVPQELKASSTNAQDDLALAQKIAQIIQSKGQTELCKEGGVLRGAARKDGSIVAALGTPGANCDRNITFAEAAIFACRGIVPDFEKSTCKIKAVRLLGGLITPGGEITPALIDKMKKDIAAGDPVLRTVVCQTPPALLKGELAKLADACNAAPSRPTTAAPSLPTKQTVQLGPQELGAGKLPQAGVSNTTAAALKEIATVKVNLGVLPEGTLDYNRVKQLMLNQDDIEAIKRALLNAAQQGKKLQGAGNTQPMTVDQFIQQVPELTQIAKEIVPLLEKVSSGIKPNTRVPFDLSNQIVQMNGRVLKLTKQMEDLGVKVDKEGKVEFYNKNSSQWEK